MKTLIIILIQLFPLLLIGQISSHKYYREDSTVQCEIIQLDKKYDLHRQIIYYYENGQKREEFFDRNRVIYDTLKQWDTLGQLVYFEIYSDTGYIQIQYHNNTTNIREIGYWRYVNSRSQNLTIYDSINFLKYETAECKKPCYERVGNWKTFYPNGIVKSEGKYLPMEFHVNIDQRTDSLGNVYNPKKESFEMEEGIIYMVCSTFLPDGKWTLYTELGEIKEEEIYINGFPINK
ncbi:MAG: hypothetical protein RLZ33_2003 [Bacteroidota bacterium]|jgi:antitoxin component YwqK of YwqJK toxin-antitoxin module